ncbi:MAG: hypothetical protein P8L23_01485, partial [Flavobacteriales bacterium]|nr:hypothetical protein [Flavobacteriales bacterium]
DVVLISGSKSLNYNKLLKSNYAKMYVLMNDMSYKQKSCFKKKCIEYGTDFHDLAKNGAFELTW